jgi:hypothetical protein
MKKYNLIDNLLQSNIIAGNFIKNPSTSTIEYPITFKKRNEIRHLVNFSHYDSEKFMIWGPS